MGVMPTVMSEGEFTSAAGLKRMADPSSHGWATPAPPSAVAQEPCVITAEPWAARGVPAATHATVAALAIARLRLIPGLSFGVGSLRPRNGDRMFLADRVGADQESFRQGRPRGDDTAPF